MAILLQLSLFLATIACVAAIPLQLSWKERQILCGNLSSQAKLQAQQWLNCNDNENSSLRFRFLQNDNITCNDGTTAGYYVKRSQKSKNWIIFLEGGWYCFDDQSCAQRMNSSMRQLMTSSYWPAKRQGTGILSPDVQENPTWWNANHVLVPYCSSDAWSGNISMLESGGTFSFMGYRIINEVIKELIPQGLVDAQNLLLAGSSAGGIGVIMNIDRVAEMMLTAGSSVKVRGLSDSGWYLEGKNEDLIKCKTNPKHCDKASDVIIKGMGYWKGVVPKKCAQEFVGAQWRCYFGHNVYRTLKSPLFIFQWQYDQTQVIAQNPATGMKSGPEIIKEIFKLARNMKQSFRSVSVSAIFLPACISHGILTKSNWLSVKVNTYTLDDAINCWLIKDSQNYSMSSTNRSFIHCRSRLVDTCKYPLCNHGCPIPRDPFTGKALGTNMGASKMIPLGGIIIIP